MPHPTTIRPTEGGAAAADRSATDAPVRLVTRAALVAAGADLLLMAFLGEVIPPLAVFAVLTVAAVVGLRRRPVALVTALAVVGLIANLAGMPFWLQDLRHPAESVPFLWAVLSAGSRFVVIVGAVLARRPDPTRTTRIVGATAVGLLGLAVVATALARATLSSDELVAGDVEARIEDTTFPDAVAVDQDGTVFLDNADPYRHTFTVEGTDLDVDLPGSVARRVAIGLAPGTYTVVCTVPGHESMRSTLEVR